MHHRAKIEYFVLVGRGRFRCLNHACDEAVDVMSDLFGDREVRGTKLSCSIGSAFLLLHAADRGAEAQCGVGTSEETKSHGEKVRGSKTENILR